MLDDIKKALLSQQIATALIVDDLYDESPTCEHASSEAWTFFFDDLKKRDLDLISGAFPGKDPDVHRSQLMTDQAFLAFLWERRRESVVFERLFEHFESETRKGRIVLDKLQGFLSTTLGLRTYTAGTRPLAAEGMHVRRVTGASDPRPADALTAAARGENTLGGTTARPGPNPDDRSARAAEAPSALERDDLLEPAAEADLGKTIEEASSWLGGGAAIADDGESIPNEDSTKGSTPEETADIVFMDLFLGVGQEAPQLDAAVDRVRKLLEQRKANPPLVVLMSSSTRLKGNVDHFRDSAELLGCQFRMLEKADIHRQDRLLDVVFRLVTRYRDTVLLASFVETWRAVLADVSQSLLRRIRRLELRDYANLKALVLDAEGERIGNYLVELYDRLFHYELEGDNRLLTAGGRLNEIDWSEFPSPHFLPAADAMEMLDNLMFHHPHSIALDEPDGLGDVFFVEENDDSSEVPRIDADSGEILTLLLVTQSCDLQRGAVGRLLFVPGVARPMNLRLHKRPDKLTTPVLRCARGSYVVEWRPDVAPFAFAQKEFRQRVDSGRLTRVRRFRAIYALQLQQQFSSALTRVGTIVGPPVRHAVAIRVFVKETTNIVRLHREFANAPENAVVMVGRDGKSLVDLLALSPGAVDQIREVLLLLDATSVAATAKVSWAKAVGGRGLYRALEHGIKYKRDGQIRPLKDADDILDIVGPFADASMLVDGGKSRLPGPLIIHILPSSQPQSLSDTTAGEAGTDES